MQGEKCCLTDVLFNKELKFTGIHCLVMCGIFTFRMVIFMMFVANFAI